MTMQELPPAVFSVIENSIVSEFATVSAAGVPIDTPTYCFAIDDLSAIGVTWPVLSGESRTRAA
jgi:hypothetical protein